MVTPFKRKSCRVPVENIGTPLSEVLTPLTKEIVRDENSLPTPVVKFENVPVQVYEGKADIPKSENYRLRELLAAGYVPEEVNIRGMFSSDDSLDDKNIDLVNIVGQQFIENIDNLNEE